MTITGESLLIIAAAVVNADPVAPTWIARSGFANTIPTRTALGVYTLTVVQAVDQARCVPLVCLYGTQPAGGEQAISVNQTDDTTFVVTISDGTVAADLDFAIQIMAGGDIA